MFGAEIWEGGMSKERIRKLAKRYQLSAEEVIRALGKLGYARYQVPGDMLPAGIVDEVEPILKRQKECRSGGSIPSHQSMEGLPPRLTDLPSDFEEPSLNAAFKDYLSARPLKQLKNLKIQPPPAEQRKIASGSPPPEATLRQSLGAEIRHRRLAKDAADDLRTRLRKTVMEAEQREAALQNALEVAEKRAIQAEVGLGDRVETLARELKAREETSASAVEKLKILTARLSEEVIARQVAEGRVEQVERRLREVEGIQRKRRLHPDLASPEAKPTPVSLLELFATRGIRGPRQQRLALEAMALPGVIDDTLHGLAAVDRTRFRGLLERRIALVCENCDVESGVVPIRLEEPERCELCQGTSLQRAADAFVAECDSRGIASVLLVGGSPRTAEALIDLVKPVQLVGLDAALVPGLEQATELVRTHGVILLWEGGVLDHRTAVAFQRLSDERVLTLRHRAAGGMLREAVERLHETSPPHAAGASLFGSM